MRNNKQAKGITKTNSKNKKKSFCLGQVVILIPRLCAFLVVEHLQLHIILNGIQDSFFHYPPNYFIPFLLSQWVSSSSVLVNSTNFDMTCIHSNFEHVQVKKIFSILEKSKRFYSVFSEFMVTEIVILFKILSIFLK